MLSRNLVNGIVWKVLEATAEKNICPRCIRIGVTPEVPTITTKTTVNCRIFCNEAFSMVCIKSFKLKVCRAPAKIASELMAF